MLGIQPASGKAEEESVPLLPRAVVSAGSTGGRPIGHNPGMERFGSSPSVVMEAP